ncbi:MAG: hypothetical protein JSW50_08175 [Candidatus Latescibacterota bacterium]|nr:MAG: hypothetical protein JSW50_08175 [Candidatus Latescibacterota bacterium]
MFVGLALLGSSVAFFASGITPPGIAGEVLRHNKTRDIDATPLFYTEVEHMQELEESLATKLQNRASNSVSNDSSNQSSD